MTTVQRLLALTLSIHIFTCVAWAENGVSESEVLIGIVNQQTSSIAPSGIGLTNGLTASFERVNRSGGIHGRKISTKVYDDAYNPAKTVEMTRKVVEVDKVFMLAGYNATSTVKAVFPMVTKLNLPFMFPRTGDKFLRESNQKWVFNFRASFEDEIDRLVAHAVERGFKSFAILYQPDALGDSIRSAAVGSLATFLKTSTTNPFVSDGSVPRDSKVQAEFDRAFAKLDIGKPEVVIVACSSYTATQVIKRALEKNRNWAWLATNNANAMLDMLGDMDPDISFSQVFPNYEGNEPFAVQYREDMKKAGYTEKEVNYISFEGYTGGRIITEALQSAGKNLTREGFVKAMESKPFQVLDLKLKWDAENHNLRGKVYLTKRKNKKLVAI